jgi:hypothetical protein
MRFPIRKHARKSPTCRLRVEVLETRLVPATFNPPANAADGAAGSLRAAVIAANGNGQDNVINLQAGLYRLTIPNASGQQENAAATGDLDLTAAGHTITFQGAGADATFLDAGQIDRAFQVFGNVTAVFRDLSITNGEAQDDGTTGAVPGSTWAVGGALLNNDGNVTLSNVDLADNSARAGPVGAGQDGRGSLGGAIYNSGGTLTLLGCRFRENAAVGGNAGDATAGSGGAGGNAGAGKGGAVYDGQGTVVIDHSTFFGNSASGGTAGAGAASTTGAGGNGGNGSVGAGGALLLAFDTVTITNSTFADNGALATPGGAGGNGSGPGGAGGNGSEALGGAIAISRSTVRLSNCTLTGNTAFGAAGGAGGAGSTGGNGGLGGNGAGGAISLDPDAETLNLDNSTVAFNEAGAGAGGAAGTGGTPGTSGQVIGGGVYSPVGTPNVLNIVSSILADNTARTTSASPSNDIGGNVATASHILLGDATGSNLTPANPDANGNRIGSAAAPIDPRLRPLDNYGGPTATLALYPDSPAIDAGANPDGLTTDQRGFGPRAVGAAPDIGAFEFDALPPAPQQTPSPSPTSSTGGSSPSPEPVRHALTVRQVRLKGRTGLDVFDAATGARKGRLFPFGALRVKVTVLTADLNGDGTDDVLALTVVGGRLRSRAFSGVDLTPLPGIPS